MCAAPHYNSSVSPQFDVVGVGLNATDTLLVVPRFPAYAGKVPFEEEIVSPGGQVASAMVACARLGLRTKYIGTIGDDERGRIQWRACAPRASIWTTCRAARAAPTNRPTSSSTAPPASARCSGRGPSACASIPREITPDQILCARLLHIDGHDTPAVAHAARIAHGAGIPVTVDVDTIYHGFDRVLPHVDYLIASSEFPAQWTNERDPLRALELIQQEYGMRVAAMTLGAHGALALENGRFLYSPAFVVNCVDTTGAGDVFHGAFCYAVLQGMSLRGRTGFLQRHGGAELHGHGRARRHSRRGGGPRADANGRRAGRIPDMPARIGRAASTT